MESESPISQYAPPPSISTPSLTDARKEELFLPESELELPSSSVLSDEAVTLDSTIPKGLKEAYNNSFVAIPKPQILNSIPQRELLEHAEVVKNVATEMLKERDEEAQVTVAAEMLATTEAFLKAAQRQYQLYLAPGAIHEEQTNQNVPTIANEIQENNFDQEGIEAAFETVKNIAMKALVFS